MKSNYYDQDGIRAFDDNGKFPVHYTIEYGKEPLFNKLMRKDAEKELGKLPKNTRAVYVVTVSQWISPQTMSELIGYRKYAARKEQMDIIIKNFKKEFPSAEIVPNGFEQGELK